LNILFFVFRSYATSLYDGGRVVAGAGAVQSNFSAETKTRFSQSSFPVLIMCPVQVSRSICLYYGLSYSQAQAGLGKRCRLTTWQQGHLSQLLASPSLSPLLSLLCPGAAAAVAIVFLR